MIYYNSTKRYKHSHEIAAQQHSFSVPDYGTTAPVHQRITSCEAFLRRLLPACSCPWHRRSRARTTTCDSDVVTMSAPWPTWPRSASRPGRASQAGGHRLLPGLPDQRRAVPRADPSGRRPGRAALLRRIARAERGQIRHRLAAWAHDHPAHEDEPALDGFLRWAAATFPCPPPPRHTALTGRAAEHAKDHRHAPEIRHPAACRPRPCGLR